MCDAGVGDPIYINGEWREPGWLWEETLALHEQTATEDSAEWAAAFELIERVFYEPEQLPLDLDLPAPRPLSAVGGLDELGG